LLARLLDRTQEGLEILFNILFDRKHYIRLERT
jgi:hypothetical protein